jgi:hypothetical protein
MATEAEAMSEQLELFEPGTHVLVNGDIDAVVLEAAVTTGGVFYEVAWWNGFDRVQQRLAECELKPFPESRRVNIGFLPSPQRGDGSGAV